MLDTISRLLNHYPSGVKKLLVSNRTYMEIRRECDMGLDVPHEGHVGSLYGVHISVDDLVPNGSVVLIDQDGNFAGMHPLENDPAHADPYYQVMSVANEAPLGEDPNWVARDARGAFLFQVTPDGARKLQARLNR